MNNTCLILSTSKILFTVLFLFILLSQPVFGQCPTNYVCDLATGTITFQFEAGNGANDQDVACDFVVRLGGTLIGGDSEDCAGGSFEIAGTVYSFTGDDGGGSSNTPITLTYTADTIPTTCPSNFEIAEAIGCGFDSDNECFTIIFEDNETDQIAHQVIVTFNLQ